jgi:hypothetical protein
MMHFTVGIGKQITSLIGGLVIAEVLFVRQRL